MASEPRINLVQISARIEVEDYAKLMRDCNRTDRKIADIVRELVHDRYKDVPLDELDSDWIAQKRNEAINKRQQKRKRRGFFGRIFGRK